MLAILQFFKHFVMDIRVDDGGVRVKFVDLVGIHFVLGCFCKIDILIKSCTLSLRRLCIWLREILNLHLLLIILILSWAFLESIIRLCCFLDFHKPVLLPFDTKSVILIWSRYTNQCHFYIFFFVPAMLTLHGTSMIWNHTFNFRTKNCLFRLLIFSFIFRINSHHVHILIFLIFLGILVFNFRYGF